MSTAISVQACHITYSGNIVVMYLGANATTPAYPTAVTTMPSFKLNGVGFTPPLAILSNTHGYVPWVAFQLMTAEGEPYTAVSTDVVTWTTTTNWVTAGTDTIAAGSGTATNYTGVLEPGVFGYLSFNLAPNEKTFKIGYNLPWPCAFNEFTYCLTQNAMPRLPTNWAGNGTATISNDPTLAGTPISATGQITSPVWNNDYSNGVGTDAHQTPTPVGTYTFICDETAPSTPTTVGLIGHTNTTITAVEGSPFAGTTVDSVEVGKTWQWTVAWISGSSTWNSDITLEFTPPGGSGDFSLDFATAWFTYSNPAGSSLGVGNPPTRQLDNPFTPDVNFLGWMTSYNGARPPILRADEITLGFDAQTGIANPTDLRPAAAFCCGLPPLSLANNNNGYWTGSTGYIINDWPVNNPTYTGCRNIPIHSIRQYTIAQSPYIYTSVNLSNPNLANKVAPTAGGSLLPYQWSPSRFDWLFPVTNTTNYVMEFVCADSSGNPIDHNLQTGQYLTTAQTRFQLGANYTAGSGTITLLSGTGKMFAAIYLGATFHFSMTTYSTYGKGGASTYALYTATGISGDTLTGVTIVAGYTDQNFSTDDLVECRIAIQNSVGSTLTSIRGIPFLVYVTSPNTFIGTYFESTLPANGGMGNVSGTQIIDTWMSISTPVSGTVPPECPAVITETVGSDLVIAVPAGATDALSTSFATRLLNATTSGTKIFVIYGNENLIPGSQQYDYLLAVANLMGMNSYQAQAELTSHHFQLFVDVFTAAGRPNDVVCVYQSTTISAGVTVNGKTCFNDAYTMMRWAQTNSYKVDYLWFAAYMGMSSDSTFGIAAGQTYATNAGSVANTSNGGSGVVLPMPGYIDITRIYLRYTSSWNGPTGAFAYLYNAIAQSGYTAYALPQMGVYETALSGPVPTGCAIGGNTTLRSAICHDYEYHPNAYLGMQAFLQCLQCPGPAGSPAPVIGNYYAICMPRQTNGSEPGTALYPIYMGPQQQKGLGTNNLTYLATGQCQDYVNQSVFGQAVSDWIGDVYSNSQPSTSTGPAPKWFPGLSRFSRRIG